MASTRARSKGETSEERGERMSTKEKRRNEVLRVSVATCVCRDAATQAGRGVGEVRWEAELAMAARSTTQFDLGQ